MDALDLVREQATNVERMFAQLITPVTASQVVWRAPGAATNSVAASLLHTYHGEDSIVHRLQGAATVFDRGGWQARLGYDPAQEWTLPGAVDPAVLREYTAAVAAATAAYLQALDPAALDQTLETPRGRRSVGNRLAVYLIGHKYEHLGEVGTLLSLQGVQAGG